MNAERLLAHYEQVADAPDAIARLRRFILDLAVRGKLVLQDASDEPASALLKRIAKEKAKAGKREKIETEIDNEEELGELPPTWCAVPLIALGSWAIGSGFPKNEQGLETGPHFFLKVSDMNLPGNEKYVTTSNNFIDDDAARRMRAKIHPPGTIIFPKIGGAIATNKRRILTKGSAIDNNCLGITFADELNVEWAFLLLTTLDFTRYQAGTAVPALQQGVLERIPVGLPPHAEQQRIVAKVDALMGLCDRLEAARAGRERSRDRLAAASLARLNAPDPETFQADARFTLDALPTLTTRPDQIAQLRQTILNLAVRGKLVPQDPHDEPVSELLNRIAKEKARLVRAEELKKEKPLIPITEETQLFEVPKGWTWVRLDALSRLITKGSSPKWQGVNYVSPEDGILFVTSENVGNYKLRKLDDLKYVEARFRDIEPRSMLRQGDILMNLVGASIGRTALYKLQAEANINQAVALVRLIDLVAGPSVEYLLHYFNSPSAVHFMLGSRVITAQPNMSLTDAREFPIPLPPLGEQRRIVTKVDALMALCDRLEASLTAAANTRRSLLDALLAEALAPDEERELEAAE
jgi:type I restriction enzyme S subunit